MSLVAKDSGSSDFTIAPQGSHIARCIQVIDLGTQFSEHYRKSAHKILFGFELMNEAKQDGEPFLIFMRRTASLHVRSTLRGDLEAWRGKQFTAEELESFDLSSVLGASAYVNVGPSDDGKYMNIRSIMSLPKGAQPGPAKTPLLLFDIDAPDMDVFEQFGDKLKATIESAEEWNKPVLMVAKEVVPDNDEEDGDLPF